jgi:hypothetical protein
VHHTFDTSVFRTLGVKPCPLASSHGIAGKFIGDDRLLGTSYPKAHVMIAVPGGRWG